ARPESRGDAARGRGGRDDRAERDAHDRRRRPARRAAFPELPGDRGRLLPAHGAVSDHARHHRALGNRRAAPVGGGEPGAGIRRGEAARLSAPRQSRNVPLAWFRTYWEEERALLGPDPWEYGLSTLNKRNYDTLLG